MSSAAGPIFIQGIMPRCGTNFLADLLTAHPDCAPPKPIWESFLLQHGRMLEDYHDRTIRHWDPEWGVTDAHHEALYRSLGDGLIDFLHALVPNGRRVVTKTPSVQGLSRFPRLFPDAFLVILVRDGRAVVESGALTFGWNREEAMHRWVAAARTILALEENGAKLRDRCCLIRYEDLYKDVEGTLRPLFRLVELDPERYDFTDAESLPVKGSSQLAAAGRDVHWKPTEDLDGFRPLERWSGWNRHLHERFNWLAGEEMERLGYSLERFGEGSPLQNVRNRLRDARHDWRNRFRRARFRAWQVAAAIRERLRRRP